MNSIKKQIASFACALLLYISGAHLIVKAQTVNNTSFQQLICTGGTQTSTTGSVARVVLKTCTIPANAIGPNGQINVEIISSSTSGGAPNNRLLDITWGGTSWFLVNLNAGANNGRFFHTIYNRAAANSQIGPFTSGAIGQSGNALITAAIDTTIATTLTLGCTLSNAGDSCAVEAYSVYLTK